MSGGSGSAALFQRFNRLTNDQRKYDVNGKKSTLVHNTYNTAHSLDVLESGRHRDDTSPTASHAPDPDNDTDKFGAITKRVRLLKNLSRAMNHEITSSADYAQSINADFERSHDRVRRTMSRMLSMAGVSTSGSSSPFRRVTWKHWLAFSLAVILLFYYVLIF